MSADPKPRPKKSGRPSGLTPDTIRAIGQSIELGMSLRATAGEIGLIYTSLRSQIRHGEADLEAGTDSIYADLAAEVARARGAKVKRWLKILETPNERGFIDPKSIQFLLMTTEPRDYAMKQTIEVEASVEHRDARTQLQELFATAVEHAVIEAAGPRDTLALPEPADRGTERDPSE